MKLCKDCKHMQCQFPTWTFAICIHPAAPVDPVYGNKNGSCDLMRSQNCLIEACGPDGDWFEQAPPPPPPPELKPYAMREEKEPPRKTWFARIFGE